MAGGLALTDGPGVGRDDPRNHRGIAGLAILVALLLHTLLAWLVLQQTVVVARPRPPISVFVVRPPPVTVPKPKAVTVPVPKPVVHPSVPVVIHVKPQSHPQQHNAARDRKSVV